MNLTLCCLSPSEGVCLGIGSGLPASLTSKSSSDMQSFIGLGFQRRVENRESARAEKEENAEAGLSRDLY